VAAAAAPQNVHEVCALRLARRAGIQIQKDPETTSELKAILIRGGIEEDTITMWHENHQYKNLKKLLGEIKDGETVLIHNPVKRVINTVDVTIYNNDSHDYALYERGHYDKDKTTGKPDLNNELKKRNNEGILEKMKPSENPQLAMIRGIKEELGEKYSSSRHVTKNLGKQYKGTTNWERLANVQQKDSYSYPRLPAEYRRYRDEIVIPELTKDTFNTQVKDSENLVGHSKYQFFTRETEDDGEFKRWILWEWKAHSRAAVAEELHVNRIRGAWRRRHN